MTDENTLVDLRLCVNTFLDENTGLHPLKAFLALGITCLEAEPMPMADQWVLRGCSNLPATLPNWLSVIAWRRSEGGR